MSDPISSASKITKIFKDFCDEKKYQIKQKEKKYNIRLEISNGVGPLTVVNIYNNNKIDIQGASSQLMHELQSLKQEIEKDSDNTCAEAAKNIIQGNMSYSIILPTIRDQVKNTLNIIDSNIKFVDNQNLTIEYVAKIRRGESQVTITQFTSGKLVIQGKSDELFHDSCDLVEKIINAPQKDVISRFIPLKERKTQLVDSNVDQESISRADNITKEKLGDAYYYLNEHDKKVIIAARCLCLAKVPLPEYSALVMPASRAFEGYVKKLTIDLGLIEPQKVKEKRGFGFEILTIQSPERSSLCKRHKNIDSVLIRLSSGIKTYRHLIMHSDDSTLNIISNPSQAEDKIDSITLDIKETYDFLNSLGLIPK